MTHTDVWVCVDCYFAHHYGVTAAVVDLGPIPLDQVPNYVADGATILWYAGESDDPSDREPLGLIPDDRLVTDNTCDNHLWRPDIDDDGLGFPCPHCTGESDEDGIEDFSWRSCQGCGSTLGGARYRLAIHDKED